MLNRCLNPKCKAFAYYGARNVGVCAQWQDSFAAFVQDMGERPFGFTLDRIDNDGPYNRQNCRWASRKSQMLNRRNVRMVEIGGVRYKAALLAELSGLKTDTIVERCRRYKTLDEVLNSERYVFRDGLAMTPNTRTKTRCKHGHEYSEANTYWTPAGFRQCRTCNSARDAKRRGRV